LGNPLFYSSLPLFRDSKSMVSFSLFFFFFCGFLFFLCVCVFFLFSFFSLWVFVPFLGIGLYVFIEERARGDVPNSYAMHLLVASFLANSETATEFLKFAFSSSLDQAASDACLLMSPPDLNVALFSPLVPFFLLDAVLFH